LVNGIAIVTISESTNISVHCIMACLAELRPSQFTHNHTWTRSLSWQGIWCEYFYCKNRFI